MHVCEIKYAISYHPWKNSCYLNLIPIDERLVGYN